MAEAGEILVDAHCHLDELERRGVSAGAALEEALAAGVRQLVSSGDGLEDSLRAAELADAHPEVYFTVGWHPDQGRLPTAAEREQLLGLASHPKAVGIGEVGLDYHPRGDREETPRDLQAEILATMLELAAELSKPVVIHQRDAQEDLLRVLDQAPPVAAMLHCFSGGEDLVAEAAARGLMCSFAGNVTFPSAQRLQAAARAVPTELLLLETDSPFLAPVPERGRTCRPALVRTTASWVAVLRGECLATLARATTANARAFFRLPPA